MSAPTMVILIALTMSQLIKQAENTCILCPPVRHKRQGRQRTFTRGF